MAALKFPFQVSREERNDPGNQQHDRRKTWNSALLCTVRRSSLAAVIAVTPFALATMLTPIALGQASSSSDAAGKVTDATGATVQGATVHLVNNATGAERAATTNSDGDWSIPNVPPANYKVRVEKQGFKTAQISSLDVEIGKTANGSVTLAVGGTEMTIEVSTLPPQLETQEATVGQVINQKQINDLPLNGRNVLQLATLAPGVSPPQTGQTGSPGRFGTRSLFITVDGGRGSSTNYVLDGTYIRSIRFNNMSIQPNVDTLQEFNLLRNSFGTEYGQGIAVVSMVTKSGSNELHGSAYDFERNSVFDARNYFATAAAVGPKPNFSRHQFGGTVGLPIKKDKLFVFGGYEGLRTMKPIPVFGFFPTQAQLGTPTTQFTTIYNPTFPAVTSTTAIYPGGNNYASQIPTTDNYDEYTVRADQTLSRRHSIFERYVDFNSHQFLQATTSVQGGINNVLIGRNGVVGDTFLFSPNLVNEARISYNQYYNWELGVPVSPGTNYAAEEGLTFVTSLTDPTQYGRASVTISGFTNVYDPLTNQGGNENIVSAGDSLSWVHGKHTWKTGFQFQNRRVILLADNNAAGAFTFSACTAAVGKSAGTCPAAQKINPATGLLYTALQNYQRGFCTSACNGNYGTTRGHYRDNTYGAFVSDVWQFGHGLTVNFGVRWEYNSPFVEQNRLEGTLDPTIGKIKYSKIPASIPAAFLPYVVTDSTYQPGILQPVRDHFGPRVGLAYQMQSGTVFRTGFGMYFDNINTNELQFTRYAAPLYYQQSTSNILVASAFPNPGLGTYGLPAPFSVNPKNKLPYTMEYNASLQQDLGHGVIMEIAYTGSGTRKLWKRYDQNEDEVVPGYASPGVSVPIGAGTRPFPAFQHGILTSSNAASANFNGGSVKVERRSQNGLYFLGSYQWSKNMDNGSGEVEANDTAYSTDFAFDRAPSRFDVRNRAVISGGYELPLGRGKTYLQGGAGNIIAGGWSLQTAIQLRGGYPFSVSRSGATFCTYCPGRVNLAPGRTVASGRLSKPGPFHWFDATAFVDPGGAYQGNVPRNQIIGPGTAQVDFSAIKAFRIYERITAQFRAEAYNIFNRTIFSAPLANISTPSTVGQVTSTSADNRSIQLGLKVQF